MDGVENQAQYADLAMVEQIQRGARNSSRGMFGPDDEDDPINIGRQAGDIIGGHYRSSVQDDEIILGRGFFKKFRRHGPDKKLPGVMRDRAARQQEEIGRLGGLDP